MTWHETRTAGQIAARLIREKILAGDLAPGAGLNQSDLATEFGMSRIPIRDALRSLAAEGFVTLRAHATASVTPLGIDDLQELYEIRLALEPELCVLALPHLDERRLREMEDTLDRMESASDVPSWLEDNNRFHELIYGASGRRRTIEFVNRARIQTERYTRIYYDLDHEVAEWEHRMILEAARRREARRLSSLVVAHLATAYDTMLGYLSETIHGESDVPSTNGSIAGRDRGRQT